MGRMRWKVWLVPVIVLMVSAALVRADQVLGGGGGGVTLQQTLPGTAQSGHIVTQGNIALRPVAATTDPPAPIRTAMSNGGGIFLSGGANTGGAVMTNGAQGIDLMPQYYNSNATNIGAASPTLFRFMAGNTNQPILSIQWLQRAFTAGVGDASLVFSGCEVGNFGNLAPCIVSTSTALYLQGAPSNGATNKVVVTTGGNNITSGTIFDIVNNGVTKATVGFDGSLTTAVPVPQASGGTGVGALTCAAGSFLTSNGTAYSCAAAPAGAILVYGSVASNGVITRQAGSPAVTVAKPATGVYNVAVTGLTTSGVVLATPGHITSTGSMIAIDIGHDNTGAAFAGFAVTTNNGANSSNDNSFTFAVLAL